jgi:hypothetical protein
VVKKLGINSKASKSAEITCLDSILTIGTTW